MMAETPFGTALPHLQLVRVEENPDRRRRRGFSGTLPPDRGDRKAFGNALKGAITRIEGEARRAPLPAEGILPHRVLRLPLAAGVSLSLLGERLEEAGLIVVNVESDGAVVAFRNDPDLVDFLSAVDAYARGPGIRPRTGERAKSSKWDVLAFIEPGQVRRWARGDRIGSRLANSIGATGARVESRRLYTVDLEFWHAGPRHLAQAALAEIRAVVQGRGSDERVLDTFVGDMLCLARVAVRGETLDRLLDADIVAEADLPPVPTLDAAIISRATARDFPELVPPLPDGPRLCIVDSGIVSSHPLLSKHIGHEEAILTATTSPADQHGHGTMVAGIAVFGDVRRSYERRLLSSPITLFSARVLNDNNTFDDEMLIIDQLRRAIETFSRAPYNCRVFNLSLGSRDPAPGLSQGRQGAWAEALDILARELKVLLVVSAGNSSLAVANTPKDAEAVLAEYPGYLFNSDAALCDPATAAIALTVGGIAEHSEPGVRRGASAEDIFRPVAGAQEPSPFTRTGPGLKGAVKPEFVANGGNEAFQGYGSQVRSVGVRIPNEGLAVMSFSNQPLRQLFAFGTGTSYAAPAVARVAAIVHHRLKTILGKEPDPNLIRAVLAVSAAIPDATYLRIAPFEGDEGVRRACGYGLPDEHRAMSSSENRAVLIAQDSIRIDSLMLYEVPIPRSLHAAPGRKCIAVSLAYDPPVRRRHAEYLGVDMTLKLLRGKNPDEILAAYRDLSGRPVTDAEHALPDRFQCTLRPSDRELSGSTLHRREFTFRHSAEGYGDTYYLMVRAERNWAPPSLSHQDFAVAVSIEANSLDLYASVRARVQERVRERIRI